MKDVVRVEGSFDLLQSLALCTVGVAYAIIANRVRETAGQDIGAGWMAGCWQGRNSHPKRVRSEHDRDHQRIGSPR